MSGASARKVIVGVDGSDSSAGTLRWAKYIADVLGVKLEVIAAWPSVFEGRSRLNRASDDWDPQAEAEALVNAWVDEALGGDAASVGRRAVSGAPARVLVEASADAEVVVVGSHGSGGFVGLMIGSVSSSVARHADCPVLITRDAPSELPPTRPIVVGVDESASSLAALRWAKALAGNTPVHAVGVWASLFDNTQVVPNIDPQLEGILEREAAEELEEAVAEVFGDSPQVTSTLTSGGAAKVLVDASADASLLVIGNRGLGGFRGLLLGSVSSTCVRHAESPVLVVRGEHLPDVIRRTRRAGATPTE